MTKHTKKLPRLIESVLGGSPTLGAEIGVETGRTSATLLERFAGLKLYLVDVWRQSYRGRKQSKNFRRSVEFHLLLTALNTWRWRNRRYIIQLPSVAAARAVDDESLDFVFIDADHRYQHVKNDLTAWYPKVRAGGLVAGHDYDTPRESRGVFGVKRAVDEFAAAHDYEISTISGNIWWFCKR